MIKFFLVIALAASMGLGAGFGATKTVSKAHAAKSVCSDDLRMAGECE